MTATIAQGRTSNRSTAGTQESGVISNARETRAGAGRVLVLLGALALGSIALSPGLGVACAQVLPQMNPVYVDDSPAATDALVRVRELMSGGNVDESVRVLQSLLEAHGERVIQSPDDADAFVGVRALVHEVILATPALLARYRELVGPRAEALLEDGKSDVVERTMLLTSAGFDAALRLGQARLEEASFEWSGCLLDQLFDHPDNAGARGAALVQEYGLLARYLDRPAVWARHAALAKKLALPVPDRAPIVWPERAKLMGRSPLDPLPGFGLEGMVSKPLWSASWGAVPPPPDPSAAVAGIKGSGADIPVRARDLYMLPAIEGDTVFINDGITLSAWDRFTLTPRWSYTVAGLEPPVPAANEEVQFRNGQLRGRLTYATPNRGDDSASVAVSGRAVVAALGRGTGGPGGGPRDGDDRVVGLDSGTGRVRWSVTLVGLDPSLSDALVRGPVLISENTAIIALRKNAPERRLVSLTLAGLDVLTGRLQWIRPIASTGLMPWISQSTGAEQMLIHAGVIYRADRLGVVAAIEAGTGRTRWVRRIGVDTSVGATEMPKAWELSGPVLDDREGRGGVSIVTITPDFKRVVRIDARTGKVLAKRNADALGEPAPKYLLRAGDRLVAVGDERISVVDLATFDTAPVRTSAAFAKPGIRGRVALVGDRLLVPLTAGAAMLDPAEPEREPVAISLEETGNVLALDNQLVVVDDARVHSYLQWDAAEKILSARIKADPKNPVPAVTFAELAYRAGRPERIGGAVDAAIASLAAAPVAEATQLARQRLFDVLSTMVTHGVEYGLDTSRKPPPGVMPLTDVALLARLCDRLGELAVTPDEKLAHALGAGRIDERAPATPTGVRTVEAVARYQSVLNDPTLASATWRGPSALVRGDLEARCRLEALIKQHGQAIYAASEAQAAGELAKLGPTPAPTAMETLAARYPLSSAAPALWLRIADAHQAGGQAQKAMVALDAGFKAAQRASSPDAMALAEIGGRLVTAFRARQQLGAASGVIRTVRAKAPGVRLTNAGVPIDADAIASELSDRLALVARWPRVGDIRTEGAQTLAGWIVMSPLLRDTGPSVTNALVMESEESVAVWTQTPSAEAPGKPAGTSSRTGGTLTRTWDRKLESGLEVRLVKLTSDAAYFLISDQKGGAQAHKVLLGEGVSKWVSKSTLEFFPREDTRGLQRGAGIIADAFNTPGGQTTTPSDLVVSMDDRTLVLTQRSGRSAGIDLETGETLWVERTLVSRVYDADLASGTLVVAGDQEITGAGGAVMELRPSVQMLDARTGRAVQRLGDLTGHPRWVKLSESGALLIGSDTALVCADVTTGVVSWTINAPEHMPIEAAWVFGDQAVLLTPSRGLLLASITSGRVRPGVLDVPRNLIEGTRQLEVFPLSIVPGSGFLVSTSLGMSVFTGEGELVGADGMVAGGAGGGGGGASGSSFIPPRPAEGRAVSVETVSEGRSPDGLLFFGLHANETATGARVDTRTLLLGARPSELVLLDGKVAITAGSVTIVLNAPVVAK